MDQKFYISKARFGQLLAGQLAAKKWQYRELADRIGVVPGAVGGYVNGHSFPSIPVFLRALDALDITPNQFFDVEPETVEKRVEVPVPVAMAQQSEPEESEWITDANGVIYCRCCRYDAPTYFDKQHRTKFCPNCGRRMNHERREN